MACRPLLLLVASVTAATACRSTPTSILLEISAPQGFVCDELRVSIYDSSRVVVDTRRLPPSGAPTLPSSVVLYPPEGSGPVRILVRALLAGVTAGEGATRAEPRPGQQVTARVALAGHLPDVDGDGVPDSIDNCPAVPNASQGPCAGPEIGTDAIVDRRRDVNASRDFRGDRGRDRAAPLADLKKDTGAKVDTPAKADTTRKPDTLKPDMPKKDAPKADLACAPGSAVFSFSNMGLQSFTVPPNCASITVKAWGAGGGAGGTNAGGDAGGAGGGGCFAIATLSVTPGEVLQVLVGGGGQGGSQGGQGGVGGANGGGSGGSADMAGGNGGSGGGGGGSTRLQRANLPLIIAAGGGGGGGGGFVLSGPGTGGAGSGGGTGTGSPGTSAPHAGAAIAGTSGGGGGGGGGSGAQYDEGPGSGGKGGVCSGGTSAPGQGQAPGGVTDPDYISGVGTGGAASPGTAQSGTGGRLVIRW